MCEEEGFKVVVYRDEKGVCSLTHMKSVDPFISERAPKAQGRGFNFFPGFFKTGVWHLKKNSEKNPDTFLINFSLENGLEIVLANQRGPRTR